MDGSNVNTTEHKPPSSMSNTTGHTSSLQDVHDYEYQTDTIDASASDVDEREDSEALGKTKSNATSIAESMPLYREVLFVAVICLGQLYTREYPIFLSYQFSRNPYL